MNNTDPSPLSDSPLRVLHVISSIDPRSGGPATALHGLALAQLDAGLSVHVAATYRRDDDLRLAEQLGAAGVPVELIGPVRGPLARHRAIAPTLRRLVEQVHIVHIHALWEQIQHQASRTARSLGKPYVMRPCGMLDPWSLAQSRWKKRLYLAWRLRRDLNQAAALHFTTQIERDLVQPLGLTAPGIVEPNGITLDEFDQLPPAGAFRAGHKRIGARRIVLFLSRLHHKKGLDLLISAFAKVRGDDIRLVIAGPDDHGYQRTVEAMVREQGLTERVLFTGMLHGRARLEAMVDAELFVLPSYQENFGIVVIEALASGTPVIISDQVNLHREVAAAGVGAVVPTQVEPLAQAMETWLNDEPRRRQAAARARPFVGERFVWAKIARRWAQHYQQLAQR